MESWMWFEPVVRGSETHLGKHLSFYWLLGFVSTISLWLQRRERGNTSKSSYPVLLCHKSFLRHRFPASPARWIFLAELFPYVLRTCCGSCCRTLSELSIYWQVNTAPFTIKRSTNWHSTAFNYGVHAVPDSCMCYQDWRLALRRRIRSFLMSYFPLFDCTVAWTWS